MHTTHLQMRTIKSVVPGFLILACAIEIGAQGWTFQNPLPTGNRINGAATNGSLLVGVGQCGTIITSTDGTTWSIATSPTARNLRAVTYAGSLFAAVGDAGTIITSANGTSWTSATSNTIADLHCVAYGLTPAKIIAAGAGGALVTSSDGAAWSAATSGTIADLFGCAAGSGTAVVTGSNGTVITSVNGTAWTPRTSGTSADLFAVAYNGSRFCAAGGQGTVLLSTDGAAWSPASSPVAGHLYALCARADTVIAAGANGAVMTAPNPSTGWTARTSGIALDLRCIVNTTAGPVALGNAGVIVRGAGATAYARAGTYAVGDLRGIATKGGTTGNVYVAVGIRGLILTSTDGVAWTRRVCGTTFDLHSIAYGSNRYVAVGIHGTLCTSTDGTTWTYDSLVSRWGAYNDLYQVKWLQNRFMATGAWGTIQVSATGAAGTWALSPNVPAQDSGTGGVGASAYNTKEYRAICRTRNRIIAVGDYGMISYCDTIATPVWANVPYPTRNWLFDVTWTGTRAIAVGGSGTILRSADGVTWTAAACSSSAALYSVLWTGDTLVAFGERGTVLISGDTGVTWRVRSSGTDNALRGAIVNNAQGLSVVGDNGSILTAPSTAGNPGTYMALDTLITPYATSINRGTDNTSYTFPSKAMVIDVTKAPYLADNTGVNDASNAIQHAIDTVQSLTNSHFVMMVVYLPNGVYKVTKTLRYKRPPYTQGPHLQGQSRSGTIIRLADSTFWRGNEAMPVISTGDGVAQCFNRGLRYLTVNTGRKNPGAIGVYYYGNNESIMSDVDIISEDGQGLVGLHLGYVEQGPALARRIYIRGFDVGIQSQSKNSVALSQITMECQRRYGLINQFHPLFIDSLRSHNKVTAILNQSGAAMTLVDANLTGGLADRSAIVNTTGSSLFARGIVTTGYCRAIQNDAGPAPSPAGLTVGEWVSEGRIAILPGAPLHSLNLPKKYPPEPAWEGDTAKWAFVKDYRTGTRTWAQAFQAAIDDASKTTVCIPAGTYADSINDTVFLRGTISRLIGTGGGWKTTGGGALVILDGTAPVVKIERITATFSSFPMFIRTARTVVMESMPDGPLSVLGAGEVYLSDVVFEMTVNNPLAKVWIHYYDGEGSTGAVFTQKSGTTRIFGWKDEGSGTSAQISGGMFEVLGFVNYSGTNTKPDTSGEFYLANAHASIAGATQINYGGGYYDLLVKQTQGATTRELRVADNPYRYNLPLFTASADGQTGLRKPLRPKAGLFSIGALIRRSTSLVCLLTNDREQRVSIRMMDARGRIVKSETIGAAGPGRQTVVIPLPRLSHGVYYLCASAQGRRAIRPVMW